MLYPVFLKINMRKNLKFSIKMILSFNIDKSLQGAIAEAVTIESFCCNSFDSCLSLFGSRRLISELDTGNTSTSDACNLSCIDCPTNPLAPMMTTLFGFVCVAFKCCNMILFFFIFMGANSVVVNIQRRFTIMI